MQKKAVTEIQSGILTHACKSWDFITLNFRRSLRMKEPQVTDSTVARNFHLNLQQSPVSHWRLWICSRVAIRN